MPFLEVPLNWGTSHIQNNRLLGATGDASKAEVLIQSLPTQPWDTKQYLPYTSVFIVNNKAEQRDYVGNAIWGAGLNSLGVAKETALWGARQQGAISGVGRIRVTKKTSVSVIQYPCRYSGGRALRVAGAVAHRISVPS